MESKSRSFFGSRLFRDFPSFLRKIRSTVLMAIRWALKAPCKAGRSFYRINHRWSKVHPPKKLGVSKNSGTPQIIHFNRVFHYKPSSLVDHYLRKPPNTLPETHSSPRKMDGWETRTFPFGMGSYVSFRECTILNPTNLRIWKIILHFKGGWFSGFMLVFRGV